MMMIKMLHKTKIFT